VDALRDALAKPETSTEELKAKMKAVRDARKKNEEALRKAREALRAVLTSRQEGKLLLAGMLD
jgi:Spy/CpxP family protein refolding chaperone